MAYFLKVFISFVILCGVYSMSTFVWDHHTDNLAKIIALIILGNQCFHFVKVLFTGRWD